MKRDRVLATSIALFCVCCPPALVIYLNAGGVHSLIRDRKRKMLSTLDSESPTGYTPADSTPTPSQA